MRSHDQTLLARLGFADPDRKDPMHDWACQYLVQPGVLGHALSLWLPDASAPVAFTVEVSAGHVETHIVKGGGQYRSTIGFADVTGTIMVATMDQTATAHLLAEVKIAPCQVSDAIRQIKLYREYYPVWFESTYGVTCRSADVYRAQHEWATEYSTLLVTAFDLGADDVAALRRERISHATLGAGYADYVTKRRAAVAGGTARSPSI